MDPFLIIVTVIVFLLLMIAGLYLIVHYQHPDDKNEAWLPKLTVLLGFVISGATVLLLPLDVANEGTYPGCEGYDDGKCGGLNMDLFWDIFYWLIIVWVFFLIPFMTFYYEADDGTLMAGTYLEGAKKSRLKSALCYQTLLSVIVGLTFGLCYLFMNKSYIPVETYVVSPSIQVPTIQIAAVFIPENGNNTSSGNGTNTTSGNETTVESVNFRKAMLGDLNGNDDRFYESVSFNSTSDEIIVPVGPSTFYAGFMAWIGWFFFAIFGGIGIAALPLDLIMAFIRRPKFMDPTELAEAQLSIRERVNDLVGVGELMKLEQDEAAAGKGKGGLFGGLSKEGRDRKKTLAEFKKAVYLLEEDVEEFQDCSANYKNHNPLIPIGSLIMGIFSILLSLLWIIHIIIYIFPDEPLSPFLNLYFRWFDNWFSLFGTLSVAIFTLYLLLCAVKGCFKFGMRLGFFTLHPMKVNKTYMSSFMFNMGLILLCALPVVQFCTIAFSDYARYTNTLQIMGTQVQYLKFFSYFWKNDVFVYMFFCFWFLASCYLFCRPRDSSVSSLELRDRLRTRAISK